MCDNLINTRDWLIVSAVGLVNSSNNFLEGDVFSGPIATASSLVHKLSEEPGILCDIIT